ncbi:MAG: DUF262 domain-containing protein [Bacteroidales bacterium]|jgi:hypothetical protein
MKKIRKRKRKRRKRRKNNMETKISIADYLGCKTERTFLIPAFQRGYKWGVPRVKNKSDALIMVENIIKTMENNKSEYFIQGVTVYEEGKYIVIIDGQQRTTTLFILLNLLMNYYEKRDYLFYKDTFKLEYKIRTLTQQYLESICGGKQYTSDTNYQDIFYINNANKQIEERIKDINKEKLKQFVLSQVYLFYIEIPKQQATKVFSMLNGSKAFMKTDELIKSEFLSKASKPNSENFSYSDSISKTLEILKTQIGEDWSSNALRSKLARQWDKWLYWWNQEEVRVFFNCSNNPMGLLLQFYYEQNLKNSDIDKKDFVEKYSNNNEDVTSVFMSFQNLLIKDTKSAKNNFENIRKLQKQFEDIYNIPCIYNYLGLSLIVLNNSPETIRYFLENYKNEELIKRYTLLSLLGFKHKELIADEIKQEDIKDKLKNLLESLGSNFVYTDQDIKETAFRMLYMLNIECCNDKNIKFEFYFKETNSLKNFYHFRSLEHIWPKSKVLLKKDDSESYYTIDEKDNEIIYDSNTKELIERSDMEKKGITEHCIGNLVFLHKNDNSKFNAKLPEDKKRVYFDIEERLYSRNLLHTMSVFAFENWSIENTIDNIEKNKKNVLSLIENKYKKLC